jgi:hypothetical protein
VRGGTTFWRKRRKEWAVTDDLASLREAAAEGDRDAVDQLVELAGERGDVEELRRLADSGHDDAVAVLVELAGEREDVPELRRLAAAGSSDARDVLVELLGDDGGGRVVERAADGSNELA